jgi:hypothetical protein
VGQRNRDRSRFDGETPYTKAEVLEYHGICCAEVEARVPALDLGAASGFHWLPFNEMELQFYNIRHLQHRVRRRRGQVACAGGRRASSTERRVTGVMELVALTTRPPCSGGCYVLARRDSASSTAHAAADATLIRKGA